MSTWIAGDRVGPVQWDLLVALDNLGEGVHLVSEVHLASKTRALRGSARVAMLGLFERGMVVHMCADREHGMTMDCPVAITVVGLSARIRGGDTRFARAARLARQIRG